MRQAVVRQELGVLAEAALKVLVLGAHSVELVQEGLISHRPRPQTLLVQHGQDAILILPAQQGRKQSSRSKEKKKLSNFNCASALCWFVLKNPGDTLTFSMRSQITALLKYSMLVHSMPCNKRHEGQGDKSFSPSSPASSCNRRAAAPPLRRASELNGWRQEGREENRPSRVFSTMLGGSGGKTTLSQRLQAPLAQMMSLNTVLFSFKSPSVKLMCVR